MVPCFKMHRVTTALLLLSVLIFSIGWKDKEEALANKKAEHWERAQKYMAKGEYPEAVIELQNVIQIHPRDVNALYELGIAQLNQKNINEAIDAFWKAARINPGNLKVRLKIGQIYLLVKKTDAARYHANRLLKEAPDNLQALTLLANIQILEKDYDSAIETLEKIVSTYPEEIKPQLTLGHVYLRRGDLEKADKANVRAVSLNPSLKNIMLRESDTPYQSTPVVARYYERLGKWAQAEKMYLAALHAAEDKVIPLKHLAALYSRAKAYRKALDALEQAYAIRDEVDTLMLTAQLHFDFGRIKEAEAIVDDVLNRIEGYVDANLLKGRIYLIRKEYVRALERFDWVIKDSSRNPNAYYYRGISLIGKGNIKPAFKALEEAVKLDQTFLDARMQLAELYLRYFEKGNLNLSREHLEAVLKLVPDHRKALLLQGDVKVREGDLEGAEAVFKEMRRITINDGRIM